jgi:hypothetical protein
MSSIKYWLSQKYEKKSVACPQEDFSFTINHRALLDSLTKTNNMLDKNYDKRIKNI